MPAKKKSTKPKKTSVKSVKKSVKKSTKKVAKTAKRPAKKAVKKAVKKSTKKLIKKSAKKPVKKAPKKAAVKSKKTASKKKPAAKTRKAASVKKVTTSNTPPQGNLLPEVQPGQPVFVGTGRLETPIFEPDAEVKAEFAEAAGLGDSGRNILLNELIENAPAESPKLSGGDIDAAWNQAEDSGEETVGGSNPTPDQDVVEELGEAMGVTYQDNEPLGITQKLDERDKHRWELNPESAEDKK